MRITTARTIVAIGVTTAACLAGGLAVASADTAPASNTAPVVDAPQTVQDGTSDDAAVGDNNGENENA
ncbi:hypothetical protein, partial [Intrasporangium sp. DVR]|uniref:hypothetical protein n=1 Tax=Intrasporangium sp. DVR TaxID=3127867 RepID=UPI00333EF1A0